MCGIAGYYRKKNPIREGQVSDCFALMKNRGPDHCGFAFTDRVLLLNTRLAIIDLDERAKQPMQSGKGLLTFNGEIYNYKKLISEHGIGGLRTSSDTEVLLWMLDRYGVEKALDFVDGMFAFAYYDMGTESLYLARDRFGEKPLYYYEADDGLYFGSEPKFISCLMGKKFRINYGQVNRYVACGYRSLYKSGETFFRSLKRVTPGHYLEVGEYAFEFPYWKWSRETDPEKEKPFDQIADEAKGFVLDAVGSKLTADVPIAFCLSGGIDSTSVATIAKKVFGYDVAAFSVLSADERYNEEAQIRRTVADLGIRWEFIRPDFAGGFENLREIVRYHEAPLSTISYYVHWQLMRKIAGAGYKVSVSGTGGDELFAGYWDHYLYHIRDAWNAKRYEDYFDRLGYWRRGVYPMLRNPAMKDLNYNVEAIAYNGFRDFLIGPNRAPFYDKIFCDSVLRNRMLNELFYEAVPVCLHEDDLNSMYFSVENRSPLLDRNLFGSLNGVPPEFHIRSGYGKAILRTAMRGLVSDEILDSRKKVGFNASVHEVFDFGDPDFSDWFFGDGYLWEIVDREMVRAALFGNPEGWGKFLFGLVSARMFLGEFE